MSAAARYKKALLIVDAKGERSLLGIFYHFGQSSQSFGYGSPVVGSAFRGFTVSWIFAKAKLQCLFN